MKFTIHQASKIGGRKYNQDRVAYAYSAEALLMVLADGMGGHLYGEIAAELTVDTFMRAFTEEAQPCIAHPESFLRETIRRSHHAIIDYARAHELSGNPGTTVVVALVQNDQVAWAHAGDSRFYLLRDKMVKQVTHDHSLVQQWVDWGLISHEQMKTHPDRNKITNCLGGEEGIFFDASSSMAPLEMGDVLLLCSDGLWNPLAQNEISEALSNPLLSSSLDGLINLALMREQMRADNTTAIAARFDEIAENHEADSVQCRVLNCHE